MGTRSTIAIKHGDRIKAVYCHWDGYVEGVGATLLENYDSTKANFLIALGNISSLGENIGKQHSFDLRAVEGSEESTWTTFYGRDRGEQGQEFKSFDSEAEWMEHYEHMGAEYWYLFDNGVWYVSANCKDFQPLHEVVAELNKEEA